MAETVYLLGAGLNQNVVDWNGLKPPLANNLFQMALRHDKYAGEHYSNQIAPVYEYISRYWKKSRDDLRNQPFNLEECFTMLQLQEKEAERAEDYEKLGEIARIVFHLILFLAEFLSEFDVHVFKSEAMIEFGKIIYRESPTVLTLNYDLILESIIENASGISSSAPKSFYGKPDDRGEVPYEEMPYSHHNWNRPLGYGIKFDEIQLQRAGISTYVKGSQFYNHPKNQLYAWTILKLHGSLNWFHYLPVRKYPLFGSEDEKLSDDALRETLLVNGHWWFNEPPDHNGWLINPLIITPVLYKEQFYDHPVFSDIWTQAYNELSKCRRLVVIGYSFAPTDFNIKKLLLEAFCENTLEELAVVNPDISVIQTIKELSHFQKPVLACQDLEEYLGLCTR
jgi:hypothetical protein